MRPTAFLIALLFLATHLVPLGAQEETRPQPQPITPSEDATLAARAAHHPELASFTAGAGDAEALVYGMVFAAVAAFSVFMGNLIGCPLGWTHSTQGKGFVPADCFKNGSKTVNYLNGCAVILGFHFYVLGYLMGLACPQPPQPEKPAAPSPEPVPDRQVLSPSPIFLLGYAVQVRADTAEPGQGLLKVFWLSSAAERAGLEKGDLILELNDVPVTRENVGSLLAQYRWSNAVEVGVLREGCRIRMTIVGKE